MASSLSFRFRQRARAQELLEAKGNSSETLEEIMAALPSLQRSGQAAARKALSTALGVRVGLLSREQVRCPEETKKEENNGEE